MDISAIARREVDASLEEWRLRTERRIAFGRVVIFGGMFTVGLGSMALNPGKRLFPLMPPLWFGSWALVALVLWRWRQAIARSTWRTVASAALDFTPMLLAPIVFPAVETWVARSRGIPIPSRFETGFYFGVGSLLLLVVAAIHSLRSDPRVALTVHWAAAAAFATMALTMARRFDTEAIASAYHDGRWHNAFSGATVVSAGAIAILGVLSARAARANRERMYELARLTILKRMVPAAAVARVGAAAAQAVSLDGERITVTLLSSDLRGFTAMSEKLTPEETVRELNAYHAAMLAVIERHGGMLDKFIGDGALVVFGPNEDHGAGAAVACARDLLLALEDHNAVRERRAQGRLAMGIGIHTGVVVSGAIGAGPRLEWTVIGDAVNTASRLEALTKELGQPVLVSAATVAHVGDASGLRELGERSVRGRAEPIVVYALASPATKAA